MKLSARNKLKGKIVEVKKGATTTHIRIDIGGGTAVAASITDEAADDLIAMAIAQLEAQAPTIENCGGDRGR